jgi:hypothetical protein
VPSTELAVETVDDGAVRLTLGEAGNPIDILYGCLKDLPQNPLADLEAEHQAEIEADERSLPAIRHRRIVATMFTFIESSVFEAVRPVYLDDDEYAELQQFMMQNPESGQLVPGSGGVRKLRWKRPGMGKRGGLRVIYFVRYKPNEFWMLSLYAKAKSDNVPGHILKELLEVFRNG